MPKPHAATLKPTPHRKTRFALALDTEGVAQLSALAAQVGLTGFYPAAVAFLASLIDADASVAFLYSVDERPRYLAVKAEAAVRRGARDTAYLDGPYVLDPVYQMFQRGQADGAHPAPPAAARWCCAVGPLARVGVQRRPEGVDVGVGHAVAPSTVL